MTAPAKRPHPSPPAVDAALAQSMGLSAEEWQTATKALGRVPNFAELGVLSVMWSEHCAYKSSRLHLSRLLTEGPKVVQGPGENAGAVDIGDGYCAVFKMESHNHPSFIEPYQGAATGVGGILRDIFTMGARPIAALNSLRFGAPTHALTPRLLSGVVAGIGGYGNCIGVPTVGGEVHFDASYNGNILVNAFALGIAAKDELFFGRASGIGNPVIYVGARTGRDGIHGATMASAAFGAEADEGERKLPTVQVGDPFMEKLLLEACLEIFRTGCIEGVQDMGAAGLTSSAVEMAARAGNGIELDLDAIPRRALGMTPYDMLLSESQERMLMVAKAGREQELFAICAKWDLEAAIVGKVTDTGRFVCRWTEGYDPLADGPPPSADRGAVVVDLPVDLLSDAAPRYNRPQRPAAPPPNYDTAHVAALQMDWGQSLLDVIGHPNIGSRAWIWQQYDHIVGNGTVLGPEKSDAAVIRVFCGRNVDARQKRLALSVDGNGRQVAVDPYRGGQAVVAECARNLVCAGAAPLGLTDCLNFGNPERPETMWQLAQAIDGIASACRAFDLPIVSGNVSLYNETDGQGILPTPILGAVGQLPDAAEPLTIPFRQTGDCILLLGQVQDLSLGASEWLQHQLGQLHGPLPALDLAAERRLQHLMLALHRDARLQSAHDISDGGLAVALSECCLGHKLGADITLPPSWPGTTAEQLFSEAPTRILVSVRPEAVLAVQAAATQAQLECWPLGTVTETQSLHIQGVLAQPLDTLQARWQGALDAVVPRTEVAG